MHTLKSKMHCSMMIIASFLTFALYNTSFVSGSSSTNFCVNDPNFRFKILNGAKKPCNWLKTETRRDLFCNNYGRSRKELVRDHCPKACGNCIPPGNACTDSADKVQFALLNGNTTKKSCSWFEDIVRKNNYCEDPLVMKKCPRTCNACGKSIRSLVEADQDISEIPCGSPSNAPSSVPSTMSPSVQQSFSSKTIEIHYGQMGNDFAGTLLEHFLGTSVAMSKKGLRIAVAAPGENSERGAVRVFDWDGQEWIQVGTDILGDIRHRCIGLGRSMDMNEDGSRIILGAPESNSDDGLVLVYEFGKHGNATSGDNFWKLIGQQIQPTRHTGGFLGYSVTINGVGDRIAYGEPHYSVYRGRVTAMQLDAGTWVQIGQRLQSKQYYASTGNSVAMDASGDRIVIGIDSGSWFLGNAIILEIDDALLEWTVIGTLTGQSYYDRFGSDVDMSEDGNRVIVGARSGDAGGKNAGQFGVYEYDGLSWNQLGQQVVGTRKYDNMGEAVVISGDGNYVAVSSPKYEGDSDDLVNVGKIQLYTYSEEDNAWIESGNALMGQESDDRLGEDNGAIAIDRSGKHLIVGAQRGNYYAGVSRVYTATSRTDQ